MGDAETEAEGEAAPTSEWWRPKADPLRRLVPKRRPLLRLCELPPSELPPSSLLLGLAVIPLLKLLPWLVLLVLVVLMLFRPRLCSS